MREVIQISQNTYRIEEEGVRYFLLEGQQRALLIDSGMRSPDALQVAKGITALPVSLFTTHADPDHISGCDAFERMYLSPLDEPLLRSQQHTLPVDPVQEGDEIDLGGRVLQVIALPGHTAGSLSLLDRENRVLIGGDAIQDGHIFMFGPGRDLSAYMASLERLVSVYGDQFDTVYPSHATFPLSASVIPSLIDAAKQIAAGTAAGKPVRVFNLEVLLYHFPCADFLLALS